MSPGASSPSTGPAGVRPSRSATVGGSMRPGGADRSPGTTSRSSGPIGWPWSTSTASTAHGTSSASTTEPLLSPGRLLRDVADHEQGNQPDQHPGQAGGADHVANSKVHRGLLYPATVADAPRAESA